MENQIVKNQESPTPALLLSQAIDKGLNVEQLEKLMGLQERWENRQAEKAFNLAMSNFQKKKPEIKKTKSGYDKRYYYAPLPCIQKQIDPVLSECGLSYNWEQEIKDDKIIVSCIGTHLDGYSKKTTLEAPFDKSGNKNDLQAMGSSNSYLFRYTLCALFGISSEEDNDGSSAKNKPKEPGVTSKKQGNEKSVDELHKEYILLFNEYKGLVGNEDVSLLDPDNWKTERNKGAYKYAIKQINIKINDYNRTNTTGNSKA